MARWLQDAGEVGIKVAIVGQPGSGKDGILRHLADTQGQASVRTGQISEAEVLRTEFIWSEPVLGGLFARVRVFAISGHPAHQAAEQMLLLDADAIVFVVDCDPRFIEGSRECLLAMMSNAEHAGVDWKETVVVMQYNHAERYPDFKPHDLDVWLGVENSIPSLISSSR